MEQYDLNDIKASFKSLPINLGDNIYICPELFRFGLFKNASRDSYYSSFYNEIKKKIGSKGTMLINTYTFQVLRYEKKFIYEKTISSSGEFSEYIRKLDGSIRSEHPVFSVSAIGRKSKYFCTNNSFHNYGNESPYCKFLKTGGKILNLGMDYHLNPFLHVAEFNIGVPYLYNKLTKVKYYKNNKLRKKVYSTAVTYRDLNTKGDFDLLRSELSKIEIYKSKLGSGNLYLYDVNQYYDVVTKVLKENFLDTFKNIRFKKNDYPYK